MEDFPLSSYIKVETAKRNIPELEDEIDFQRYFNKDTPYDFYYSDKMFALRILQDEGRFNMANINGVWERYTEMVLKDEEPFCKWDDMKYVGGILGVLGVCILIYPNLNNFQGFNDIKGIMVAILGTLLTAIGDASSARNASHKVNPIYANAIGFTVGSLLMGVVVLFQGQEFTFPTSFSYVFMLLYLALFASFVAWLFYLKLVEKIGGAQSGYMVALFPVIGGIASVLIGESDPSLYLFVGCFSSCIGAAIALGFRAQKQESKLTLKKVN